MIHSQIDHLVITAPSLATGVEYVRSVFGVSPQVGGAHPRMGTHNCLLRVGKALYLEVISIDPNAPKPDRSRWFNLDQEHLHFTPHLTTWVARTNDISAASVGASVPIGDIESMSRGQFEWQITIPSDGSLLFDGVAPSLIQWDTQIHPASLLDDLGCTLLKLEGYHPQAAEISELLQSIGLQDESLFWSILPSARPSLKAQIQTPFGVRSI